MNEFRFVALFKEKLEDLELAAKFRQLVLTFAESPYVWGGEEITGADCSGVISGVLQFLGYSIRTTADRFYKVAFKDTFETFDKGKVTAIFFVDGSNVARHVGIFVAENIIFHASGDRNATFDNADDLIQEYEQKGYFHVIQELDWEALEELEGEVSGLDNDYL